MSKTLNLRMKNEKVMNINLDEGIYEILQENLMPYTLKGRFSSSFTEKTTYTHYEMTQILLQNRKNYESFLSFLSNRILPLSRENAKKIYNLFGLSQVQDDLTKAKVALLCRGLSLQDNYWLRLEDDPITWEEVDLRRNPLNEAVTQVSLYGSSLSLQKKDMESLHTPEESKIEVM